MLIYRVAEYLQTALRWRRMREEGREGEKKEGKKR